MREVLGVELGGDRGHEGHGQLHAEQLLQVELPKPRVEPHVDAAVAQAAEALGHRWLQQVAHEVAARVGHVARELERALEDELVRLRTGDQGDWGGSGDLERSGGDRGDIGRSWDIGWRSGRSVGDRGRSGSASPRG